MPDLPLLEKSAANLGAKVGVGPGEIEAIGRVAFGSKFSSGISQLVASDACVTGCPPYLDC